MNTSTSTLTLLQLPVEILHRIFDDLDTRTIFLALRGTCVQLQAIVHTYNRYELNLTTAAITHFQVVHKLIGLENIISLVFVASSARKLEEIEFLLSILNSEQLPRLCSLNLVNIRNQELDQLTKYINNLPLVSLSVRLHDMDAYKKHDLFLNSLRQCHLRKLSLVNFGSGINGLSLPHNCILTHLTIGYCSYQDYHLFLKHCPYLKGFVMERCTRNFRDAEAIKSTEGKFQYSLVSLTINGFILTLKELHSFLSLTPSLIRLKLTAFHGYSSDFVSDGFTWEQLIQEKLHLLKEFNFRFERTHYLYSTCSLHTIIAKFRTPFWLENKRWFVNADYVISSSLSSPSYMNIYTVPMYVENRSMCIRCEALSTEDICYFTDRKSCEKQTLTREDTEYGRLDIPFLACVLKHDTTLVTLNLRRSGIGSKEVRQLASALQVNKTLSVLEIGGNRIGPEGLSYLSEILKTNTTLVKLGLGGNKMGSEGINYLLNALESNCTLTSLDIQANHLGIKGIMQTVSTLRTNKIMTSLDLSSNEIEATGAQYVGQVLEQNSTLTTINLRDNEIRSDGAKYLADVLKTLKTISLRFNRIDDDGAEYFADTLRTNTSLTTLNLSHNEITDQGVRSLANALKNNTTLTILDLERNRIGSIGMKFLADMLLVNMTLTILNLSNNRIKDKGAQYLSNALEKNKTLRTLDLGLNQIGDEGVQYLAHACQNNQAIMILNLPFYPPISQKPFSKDNK